MLGYVERTERECGVSRVHDERLARTGDLNEGRISWHMIRDPDIEREGARANCDIERTGDASTAVKAVSDRDRVHVVRRGGGDGDGPHARTEHRKGKHRGDRDPPEEAERCGA
jgi:hypothetical protein